MRILISELTKKAEFRPEGYLEEVMSIGTVNGEFLQINDVASLNKYKELWKKYNTSPLPKIKCCPTENKASASLQKMPTKFQMLKNIASTAGQVIKNTATGKKVIEDKEEFERRLSICKGCEFYDNTSERCRKCGCFMNVKAKLAGVKCPIDKW